MPCHTPYAGPLVVFARLRFSSSSHAVQAHIGFQRGCPALLASTTNHQY